MVIGCGYPDCDYPLKGKAFTILSTDVQGREEIIRLILCLLQKLVDRKTINKMEKLFNVQSKPITWMERESIQSILFHVLPIMSRFGRSYRAMSSVLKSVFSISENR